MGGEELDVKEILTTLKGDVETLITTLKKVDEALAKVSLLSDRHVVSVRGILIALMVEDRSDLAFQLHNVIIESHELSKQIRSIYNNLNNLKQILKGLNKKWVKLDIYEFISKKG